MTSTISRLYNSHVEAQEVVKNLEAAGVKHGDISILQSNADNWYSSNGKPKTIPDRNLDGLDDRAEGAGTGAGVGAAVGGAVGLLTGLGLMAIPGVGPIVAAGWLAAALAGAAAGGTTGGVIGALTQAGVNNEEADIYAESLRRGGALVSVKVADADTSRVQAILDRGAVQVADRGNFYRKSGWQSFDPKSTPYTSEQIRKERDLYR
jgi:glutamate 5-kinase